MPLPDPIGLPDLVGVVIWQEHPGLAPDFEEISELCSRAILSFLLFEGRQKKSIVDLEDYVRRRLVPGLGLESLTPR